MSLAQLLADARVQGRKLDSFPSGMPDTETEAFSVQCQVAKLTGWTQVGWKIGCTSTMAREMLRASGPFPGPLFAERTFENDHEVPVPVGEKPIHHG